MKTKHVTDKGMAFKSATGSVRRGPTVPRDSRGRRNVSAGEALGAASMAAKTHKGPLL